MQNPFHLAFPIKDIEETKAFYKKYFNCKIGREDKKWVDFDFYGGGGGYMVVATNYSVRL